MIKVNTKLILHDRLFYFFKFHSSLYVSGSYIYAATDLNCYKFMDHRSELSDAVTQIINALSAIQTASQENQYSLQTYMHCGWKYSLKHLLRL